MAVSQTPVIRHGTCTLWT